MADEIDHSERMAYELLTRAIAHAASQKLEVEAIGKCHNCGTRLSGGLRWCDADCRTDWERRGRRA